MVDTKAINVPFAKQLQDELVRLCEYRFILLTHGCKIIYVKKSTVINVVRGDAPVC